MSLPGASTLSFAVPAGAGRGNDDVVPGGADRADYSEHMLTMGSDGTTS